MVLVQHRESTITQNAITHERNNRGGDRRLRSSEAAPRRSNRRVASHLKRWTAGSNPRIYSAQDKTEVEPRSFKANARRPAAQMGQGQGRATAGRSHSREAQEEAQCSR